MLKEKNTKRPLSGKFPLLKCEVFEKPKIIIQNNKLKSIKELSEKLNKGDKVETKLYTRTFAETKENNNSSFNQITDKTEFLEMISKEKETEKEALDNIIINEVNRINDVNQKKKKLNEINLIEKNYDELYTWENLFNNSRPLSHYTTLKKRKITKREENKELEEFKSPVILVDLHEEQMNLFFGKKFFPNESSKKKIKSAKKNFGLNNNKTGKNNININTNNNSNYIFLSNNKIKSNSQSQYSSINNTLKSKKSVSARNRIISSINTRKSQKKRDKTFHKHIRPMSVYSPRVNTGSFYFSNTFSDYYKEDLKSFSEKMKILKAKIKSNQSNLKNEIKTQRKISKIKERKLEDIINSNNINFDKSDLIIAADRKNPIPLLKSIFKTNYPDKEFIKENIKMYYNTMKPMGNWDNNVDFTQNKRWRFIEKFSEMREGIKTEYRRKEIGKNKNLILNYYNEDDPHIQMFQKIVRNNKQTKIKYLKDIKEKNELNKIKSFNPILNNIEDNFQFLNENNKDIKKIKELRNGENLENEIDINTRPKTGFKSVASHIETNFNFYFKDREITKRPQTSNVKEISIIDNNYYVPFSNLQYKYKVSFPIKTSSKVGNVSYDKINHLLQERHFGLSKMKYDYFMTSTGQVKAKQKNLKYNEEKILLTKDTKNNKIYDFGNISKFGLDSWTENGTTPREKAIWTKEYFKNFRGKHYSSSNNVHIKNQRKNKAKLLNKYYTQSQYSNDDPDLELIDKSISSQTNSLNRKI